MQWDSIHVAGEQDKNVDIFRMDLNRLIMVMVTRWTLYISHIRWGTASAINDSPNLSSLKYHRFIFCS